MKVFVPNRQQAGQTLIETALVLFLILMILLGVSEFSRLWFAKNSLKNAARSGVRLAVVTQISAFPTEFSSVTPPPFDTDVEFECPNANLIINTVCTSPGVKNTSDTHVILRLVDEDTFNTFNAGDTITVTVTRVNFKAIVPGFFRLVIPSKFSGDSSMRREI